MKSLTITITTGYEVREMGGEFHIINTTKITSDPETFDCPATLNEKGLFLWNWLLAGKTMHELVLLLIKKEALDPEDAEQDVAEFIAKLKNSGAVSIKNETGGGHNGP